ncbi:transcriptional regulator family: Centromere protein B, DNA-binding region [Penicillium roqueforti]|uniref:transcriptional regulator family: Centromere protein B, DNA-binding region n=1 Tax=Penicillium roqueforti TaxID=5082 RepID=UPI001909766B|nr:transcriptional regulator family: Centromere protein B, DNA-binding region [Penicillium roqueforti]KAF9252780.1 transcriptional regulator family: Centromere protein B, DNA-binding region [Penicillium roqueforti]KAI1830708.1 transcriptional regulator family: Centromere protein B, DNA-binding region [Penicillium roqueforti]KAI2675324.1 transcriptional regulator family: Centromere protein B, DNA-binding region [Penicillium roqueforti]KAI2679198.1 transcriptional regulator family: Centromere pro
MPKTNKDIEQQIQLAMDSLSDQSKPNIRKTAREFAVPEGRLRRRWRGGKSLFERQPNGRKLNSAQEKALCAIIASFHAVGSSITRRQITDAADSILKDGHNDPTTEPPRIGDHWLKRFLKRNPNLFPTELESSNPHGDNLSRPDTPSVSSQETEFSTPKTAEEIRRISDRLNRTDPNTQRFKDGLAKLAKGAEAQATLALQLQRELDRTHAIMGARNARYDAPRRHIPIAGIINSS